MNIPEGSLVNLYYDIFEVDLGWIGVLASDKGLKRITLPQTSIEASDFLFGREVEWAILYPEHFENFKRKLILYFQGVSVSFHDEAIDVGDASPFSQAAWQACRSIPRGHTGTYGWIAIQLGKPQAARAVGQSMARNPLPIITPCHRVISSDGSLRGFGGGSSQIGLKKKLIEMEMLAKEETRADCMVTETS